MQFPPTTFFYRLYLSKANYLVTAKHVSKEDALVELNHYYYLSLEEVLTTMGTTSMTSLCSKAGIGAHMGNAPQEVKDEAAVVTRTIMKTGWASG